jgi:hypothetical protein
MGRDPAKIMSALLTYIPGFGNFCQAFRPIANEKVFHGLFSLIFRRNICWEMPLREMPYRKLIGRQATRGWH